MRLHKPVGILLLWWPTAWAIWLANDGEPSLLVILLFLLGTIFMRSAGCVVNDIADRHIDIHVERTKARPLTTGEVGLIEALTLLGGLLLLSLMILLQLPKSCFYFAVVAVLVTAIYPFCKRFIQSPQLILGIAFSMGIPMAFAAANQLSNKSMFLLLIINGMWVIAYDTEYAMADRADDLRIGVKSTAILFAEHDKLIIALLQLFSHFLWLPLGLMLDAHIFWFLWVVAGLNLVYQQKLINKREPANCLRAFISNNWYGLFMWIAIVCSR